MTTPLRVRGACPHDCPDTCGIVTEVEDGRAVGFRGDPDHPITARLALRQGPPLSRSRLPPRPPACIRCAASDPRAAASGSASPGTRRSTRSPAAGRRSSPASAPRPFCPTATAARSAWCRCPSPAPASGTGSAPASCNAASAAPPPSSPSRPRSASAGVRPTPTWLHSKLVVLWGYNPVTSAPHFMPFLKQAQRAGCQVVVIDPRRSQTARGADLHLAPRPGTRRRPRARPGPRPRRGGTARRGVAVGPHRRLAAAARAARGVPAGARRRAHRSWRSRKSSAWPGSTRPGGPVSSRSPTASTATATAARTSGPSAPCRP